MARTDHDTERRLRDEAARHGQTHLFRFWESLTADRRRALLEQIAEIDFEELSRLAETARRGESSEGVDRPFEPSPFVALEEGATSTLAADAVREGERALRAGRVAVLVVAGGQGTRLGFPGPKGTFPIGPISGKSLYQLHAEKILAIERRYRRPIRWYVLTSEATHEDSREFFEANRFFGLVPERVRFIEQGMLPAIDRQGRILLEAPDRVFRSPNGHGGVVDALRRSGALDEMRRDGVDLLFYFQVDNPLVRIADPSFIGHHLAGGAEMSLKIVRKVRPEEKVGVLVMREGQYRIVEYSELSAAESEERLPGGAIRFQAGNIAIHLFSRSFLERVAGDRDALPLHRATKKIPHVDEHGVPVEPSAPNGFKFERFVFDCLPLARGVVAIEVARADEFSPVKNATGSESPETSKADLMALHRRWLAAAGARLPEPANRLRIEISPLFALDADELREKLRANEIPVTDGMHLESR
ncbi:MAG: UDPGP type 1 family protein [Planctomycetes bacterium]|nr:UDPGP type 1 family protein [Planctomycetota bacterium]MBI3844649.1 UDPGP type 1 family protein [Planctomycetota bacterium]